MKFEEKLMNLRKQNGLSQEDLAEKLDVTRQTVSKWELGQSKPDMEKLIEIGKIFNVPLESLTDDNASLNSVNGGTTNPNNGLKIAIIIAVCFILIAFIIRLIFVSIMYNKMKQASKEFLGAEPQTFFSMFFDIFNYANDNIKNEIVKDKEEEFNEKFWDAFNTIDQRMEKNQKDQEGKSQDIKQNLEQKIDNDMQNYEFDTNEWLNTETDKMQTWLENQSDRMQNSMSVWSR